MMNGVDKTQAAITRLEALKAASDDDPQPAEWLLGDVGTFGIDIVSRYAIDQKDNEVVAERVYGPDAELIVTLHRTIEAQLAILRSGLEWLYEFELEAPTYADGRPMSATRIFKVTSQGRATLALADAILGDA